MDRKTDALADILLQDVPPERDPAFRLAVLERRARQIFRRRLVGAVLAALAFGLALTIAKRASVDAMEIGALLIVVAGLGLSWRFYAPVLAHWVRTRLRED